MSDEASEWWSKFTVGAVDKKPTQTRITIESVGQFVDFIKENDAPWTETVYRGHENRAWPTQPSILRGSKSYLSHEHDMIRDLMAYHPQEFAADATMFDRLVRMQHYGLPTRLVDVTQNPLVALYFASGTFKQHNADKGKHVETDGSVIAYHVNSDRRRYYDSNTVAVLANLANLTHDEKAEMFQHSDWDVEEFNKIDSAKRLVRFIRHEKPHFENIINPVDLYRPLYVRPRLTNKRIIAQSGAFLIYGLVASKSAKRYERTIKQLIVTIPAESKTAIRNELNRFAINSSTLFPEIDKASAAIKERIDQLGIFG